ncbi:MAG: DUF3288 family protein [Cyanobacteriota bacterium]|nr:DUF3288 family protein [Cyanobacteriota bacterium]
MSSEGRKEEQTHPQYKRDRSIVEKLLSEEKETDRGLAELARLKIRYRGFPGARDIQDDLEKMMDKWDLTEESLYQKTRKINAKGKIFREKSNEQDDWM